MTEDSITKKWVTQPMLKPRIDKVVVNLNVGKSGTPLENASNVLIELTGQKPIKRKAKKTIRDFGIRQGEPISCIVTLRKQPAITFLKKVLPVLDNKLSRSSFDRHGNFAFGLKEHIEIAGVKYDPNVGIFGMDISITMEKPGYRIKRRRIARRKIPHRYKVEKEETMKFFTDTFNVEVIAWR